MFGPTGARLTAVAESTWTERELLILEAIRAAEEAGSDFIGAARKAVPDLSSSLYARTIDSLAADGFLDADIHWKGDGEPYLVIVKRLLPEGRRAIGQWPSNDPGVELERVLAEAIDREPDPERRTRLERLRATVAETGRDAVKAVLIELAKRTTLG